MCIRDRLEGQKYNVHVNALTPVAYTRMTANLMPPEAENLLTPESVTPAAIYLVSDKAPNGTILCAGAGVYSVSKIMELYPDVNFVWVMGSDCAAEISQWKDWEKFLDLIPIAIYPRPSFEIESNKLDLIKERAKIIGSNNQKGFTKFKPPVITFIPGPMSDISSSQIRKLKDG